MPQFLADGNQGFDILRELKAEMLNKTDFDIAKPYLRQRGLLYPAIEGRITLFNDDMAPSSPGAAANIKISALMISFALIVQGLRIFV